MRNHFIPTRMAITNINPETKKCWRGCGETGTFIQGWWHCKMVQPMWKTVWQFLNMLKQRITTWPSNTTTRYMPKETENLCSNKNLYTNVYTSMLHNSLKVDRPKCASTGERINKMWYTYTIKHYSLVKRNEVLIYASTWTLKTLKNERNQSQK